MKTKNKNKTFVFIFILLIAGFFSLKNGCLAEPVLKITDIQFENQESVDNDFIEITNTTDEKIELKEYRLVKKTSSGKRTNIISFDKNDSVSSGKKYLWASSKNDSFPQQIGADVSRKETITESNGIAIIFGDKDSGIIIDSVNWKEDEDEGEEKEDEKEKDDEGEKKNYSKIQINEIYPAPNTKDNEEEFVEIKNESEENIDFSNWIIKDSKGKKGKISQTKKNGGFFVFYGSFSLNNDSKGDTVFLYDEKENLVDSQEYANGKSTYSYSFDESAWRWTSSSTPGQENKFDKILSGKIIKDDKIYVDIYVYFDVKADKDAKKFTWNFGDGHKSYLKTTKHKYEKAGKYSASLKITGDGEDKIYEFEIKVEKYKAPKVKIISLSPNPKGNDTDNEWIEIKNESKKKVNLKDWSIATGWEKFINHPIREDFEIKAGKTKKLLRDICAFTLVNTKDKIELRSPDGKAVQKIEYDHGEKSVEEDDVYQKTDSGWIWIKSQNNTNDQKTEEILNETKVPTPNPEIQASLGKYSLNPNWKNNQKNRIRLVYSNFEIELPEKILTQEIKVLGAKTIQIQKDNYIFTKPENRKHWIMIWSKNIFGKINFKLNLLLNKLS